MKLQHIDITDLKISPLNVRKHGETNGGDLVPSIKALGLLQPLLVRPNCEGFEIVAGQRRFHACQSIAQDGGIDPLPCIVMDDDDDARAIEASLAENIARLPMDELDQYEAFRELFKQGCSVEDAASHFGVTERLVKQRLALANLHPPILSAYRREELCATTMRILTMATKSQQKAWFKLFKSEDEYAPEGHQLKSWLFGGDQIPASSALFDLETYKGSIVTDLFGDEGYFSDSSAFWESQSQAIAVMIEDYGEDGWSDVILLDVGQHWSSWEHVDTAKENGGKVYIHVAHNGEVTAYEGQLSRSDIKKREKLERGEDEAPVNDRPEITQPMQNYLALHRHSAVRTQLLNHQGIALRLAVAQVIAGSSLWDINADPQRANTEAIKDSLKANTAEDLFSQERMTVRGLLELADDDAETIVPKKQDWGINRDLGAIFARLLKLDDETVTRILTFVVAETLPCGSAMVEVLGNTLSVDMADHWKPDDTATLSVFFDLLRDKEAINAMVREVAGKNAADGNVTETAKVQKQIIRDCLDGTRKAAKKDWQPRYMAFPMTAYTKHGGIDAIRDWNGVKKHFKTA